MDELKQLYIKYEKQIYKYLFYLSRDKLIAEELTQETFFQVLKSIHSFKGDSKVSTWLFQIAKYTFYNYLGKHKKKEDETDISLFENELSNGETPENIYEDREELGNQPNFEYAAKVRNLDTSEEFLVYYNDKAEQMEDSLKYSDEFP